MNGIQGFYVGGRPAGGFRFTDKGKNVSTANQRVRNTPERSREEQQKNIGNIMKDMRENRKSDRMKYQQQLVKENNFVDDLKKLIAPSGQTYLFTQHPGTKAFMKKYGLNEQDIIKLRLGATERGFQGNIRDVGAKAIGNLRLSNNLFDPQAAIRKYYEKGMSPMDRLPSTRGGIMGFVEDKFGAGPFSKLGDFLAGGSPQGVAGMYYLNQQLDPQGNRLFSSEQAKQLGAVSANIPSVYDQLMATPELLQRGIDEFSYSTQKGLPRRNNQEPQPAPADPITAAYNPAENPYGSFGIGNFV
jgi:hypothetical protein